MAKSIKSTEKILLSKAGIIHFSSLKDYESVCVHLHTIPKLDFVVLFCQDNFTLGTKLIIWSTY